MMIKYSFTPYLAILEMLASCYRSYQPPFMAEEVIVFLYTMQD